MLKIHHRLALRHQWLPAETLAGAGLFFACFFHFIIGYPLLLPGKGGALLEVFSGTAKYASLVLYAVLLYSAVAVARGAFARRIAWGEVLGNLMLGLRLLLSLTLALYLMLLFKWWAQLGPAQYDGALHRSDLALAFLRDPLLAFARWADLPEMLYFRVFGLCFILAYLLLAAFDIARFARLVTATVAVCILGGIAYGIAPAYGPFMYETPGGGVLAQTQAAMLAATRAFAASRGEVFEPSMFEGVLGAMPSLHVAHTVAIASFMAQFNRWLGALFWVMTLYIAVYAVATGFHYLIDLPAGLALGLLAAWASDRLHHRHQIFTQPRLG